MSNLSGWFACEQNGFLLAFKILFLFTVTLAAVKKHKCRVSQNLKQSEFRIFGSTESCHNVAQWEQISRKNCKVCETPAQLDSVPDSVKIRIVIRRRRPFIYNISSTIIRVCHDENFWAKICQQFLFSHRTMSLNYVVEHYLFCNKKLFADELSFKNEICTYCRFFSLNFFLHSLAYL